MRAVQVEQRTTSSALPNQRTHPVAYLLAGGLIAGTLDILCAYTFWAVKSQIPAQRIFQDVAAGLVACVMLCYRDWASRRVQSARLWRSWRMSFFVVSSVRFRPASKRSPALLIITSG